MYLRLFLNEMELFNEKNRHLLKIVKAIITSMYVPKFLWGEEILAHILFDKQNSYICLKISNSLKQLQTFFFSNLSIVLGFGFKSFWVYLFCLHSPYILFKTKY